MLNQILSNTPVYVWVILLLLVTRGLAAMREREMAFGKLLIIPLVMLALSLHDMSAKFGLGGLALAAWGTGMLVTTLLAWKLSGVRITAGQAPGSVRVRGSWVPLALMMAVFCTKYAVSVLLAVQPHVRGDALFAAGACLLFGLLNGCFIGRLLADVLGYRALQPQREACSKAMAV